MRMRDLVILMALLERVLNYVAVLIGWIFIITIIGLYFIEGK